MDKDAGTVSVLTRGDLLAESGDPTGQAERSVLGGQESAEAIVPEPSLWEGPNIKTGWVP